MRTAFFNLVLALEAVLGGEKKLAEVVSHGKGRAVSSAIKTAIDIKCAGARPMQSSITGPVDWLVRYEIDCYARAKEMQGDEAVDSLVFDVYQRLRRGVTLGRETIELGQPEIMLDVDDFAEKTGWAQLAYTVNLRTANDLLE